MINLLYEVNIMKKFLILFLNILFIIPNLIIYEFDKNEMKAPETADSSVITIVSANARCIALEDLEEKTWFVRAPLLIENLRSAEPDVICFQEVTAIHYSYFMRTLSGYDSVIRYRDLIPVLSEGCPVFYNTNRFDLVKSGSFWLSETPERMSKDWNSGSYRICSYVVLSQKTDGKQFAVFSTHLDNESDEARINGVNVMLDKLREFGDIPAIFAGDFNTTESGLAYKAVTEVLDDAKYRTGDSDSGATYHAYGREGVSLDYFMISKTGINVEQFRIIRTDYDGVYPSDHYQIMMKMTLE